jgi:hypothetical protein
MKESRLTENSFKAAAYKTLREFVMDGSFPFILFKAMIYMVFLSSKQCGNFA